MRLLLILTIAAILGVLALARLGPSHATTLAVDITPARLTADGYSRATLRTTVPAAFAIVEGQHAARIEGSDIIAGVLGGRVVVEARAPGLPPARATLETVAQSPDEFLVLDDEADRTSFTRWFTFLAESQYFARAPQPEIVDCAALLRFAYREALRAHDGQWAGDLQLAAVPAIAGIRKYTYPFTPLGARLFRTGEGPEDFAEFADAQTLRRYNTYFISRDLRSAASGDLLFYRQLEQNQPFHTMIFLGDHVVYHTGPFHGGPGEMRRPSVEELLHHPGPQWRPHPGNPNFLGVYRWNILRRSP